jgi:hypothetical protein
MSGLTWGAVILAWTLGGMPLEHAVSDLHDHHIIYVVKIAPRGWPWRGKKIKVTELGHSKRIVYEGPWEGDDGDFEGMVNEAKRQGKR